jgi:hypothetical protein
MTSENSSGPGAKKNSLVPFVTSVVFAVLCCLLPFALSLAHPFATPTIQRVYEESGFELPRVTQLYRQSLTAYFYYKLWYLSVLPIGLLVGAHFATEGSTLRRIVLTGYLTFALFFAGGYTYNNQLFRSHVESHFYPSYKLAKAEERARALALAVGAAVQESFLKNSRLVEGSKSQRYIVYEGPGLALTGTSKLHKQLSYDDLCAQPQCWILPSAPSLDNVRADDEWHFAYPKDPKLNFKKSQLDEKLFKTIHLDLERDYRGSELDPDAKFIPTYRTVLAPESEGAQDWQGLSYNVLIERSRGHPSRAELKPQDKFQDRLYQVHIRIFIDFQADIALKKQDLIPSSNLAVLEYVTLVRLP